MQYGLPAFGSDDATTPAAGSLGGASASPSAQHQSTSVPIQAGQARRVGGYLLESRLGGAGMSEVWRAVDSSSGRMVALKLLPPTATFDEEARARLRRECDVLQRLTHPWLARVMDAQLDGGEPFIATRYIPADTLDVWVKRHGPMTGTTLVQFVSGLIEALQVVHRQGIVHRDVKPGNVLVHEGNPVVIDFGISQLAADPRLTRLGQVMGTMGYVPPELLEERREPDEVSDWWGLAATIAFAASGKPPFGDDTGVQIQARVLSGQCSFAGADARLIPLLAAALKPSPQERATPAEIIAAWTRYARGGNPADVLRRPGAQSPVTGGVPVISPPAAPAPTGPPVAGPPAPPAATSSDGSKAQQVTRTQPQPVSHTSPMASPGQAAAQPPAQVAPVSTPPPAPRQGSRARTGTVVALALGAATIAGWAPWYALVGLWCWSVAARAVDRAMTSVMLRRMERGETGPSRDIAWAVVGSPMHVIAATISSTGALILPSLVFVGALVGGYLGVWGQRFTTLEGGSTTAQLLMGAYMAMLVTAWWGPTGGSLRRGSRQLVRAAAPGVWGARVAVTVFVVLAVVVFLVSQSSQFEVSWSPWGNPLRGIRWTNPLWWLWSQLVG